jgi:PucR family transcriptional regulator, purine catabolism regulatory protein
MPDITLRDLCRWDRRLSLIPPTGASQRESLDRAVSWVVSARATPPLLPPLRGDELVVLSRRVLDQIESSQMMSVADLIDTLADEPIAALLTEHGFTEGPLDDLPVLTMPAPFSLDAEGTLNRLLTERRAELYRLGNDLSRRVAQAAMDPRGVEALLEVAASVGNRPLVLQDAAGNVVARGGGDTTTPAEPDARAAAGEPGAPRTLPDGSGERLIVSLPSGAGYLSMTAPDGALNEGDRLVLTQTAGACAVLLGQRREPAPDSGSRRQLVADLMLGRLASDAALAARARGLGIDPARPIVAGIVGDGTGSVSSIARDLIRRALGPANGQNQTPLPGGTGFVLNSADTAALASQFATQIERLGVDPPPVVVLGRPVTGAPGLPEALREVRFALALAEAGRIPGPVVRCDVAGDLGPFALLYHLWGDPAIDEFQSGVLGALAEYDQRRESRLLETLGAYLDSGGSVATAAERLGVHRNTLSYRIRRIEELTGRDLGDPHERLLFHLASICRALPPYLGPPGS